MRNRWGILAVLFTVRLTMGFQFQSIAAVAPLLGPRYGARLADIGLLIGLYFTPGVALSLPGGAIGQKFGDKITVIAALLLMLAGGLAMAFSHAWSLQIAGRLVAGAGAGGVLLNVQMTKMVTDWFAGKEIATAMAVFVVSWPAGVALSLLALPAVGVAYGVSAVGLVVAGSVALGIVLLAATYRSPDTLVAAATNAARPDLRSTMAVIVAGVDLGPVQCRVCRDLQFRALDAGRTRLVDRLGRIGRQHRAVARGAFRPLRRISRRLDRAATIDPDRRRRAVFDADAGAAARERGDRNPHAQTRHPRHRHGHLLHGLLRHHDAGADRRRSLRQMGRECGGGVRFRRGDAAGMPAAAVGVQPHRGATRGIVVAASI